MHECAVHLAKYWCKNQKVPSSSKRPWFIAIVYPRRYVWLHVPYERNFTSPSSPVLSVLCSLGTTVLLNLLLPLYTLFNAHALNKWCYVPGRKYCIAENFRGRKLLRFGGNKIFMEKGFADCLVLLPKDATPPILWKTFANIYKTSKFMKGFSFESFLLYGMHLIINMYLIARCA